MSYKKLLLTLLLFLGFYPSFSSANFETQWFTSFKEANWKIDFSCEKQCFIVIGEKQNNNILNIKWNIFWTWSIWYWFINSTQIIPGEFWNFPSGNIDNSFLFTKLQYYSQLPDNIPVVLVFNWVFQSKNLSATLSKAAFFDDLISGFSEALEYKEFSPRTINFLEWPMWNWKYINQVFFLFIVILLVISFVLYYFTDKNKKNYIYTWFWILLFFWLFFDFFNTVNQINMFKDFSSSEKIIDNWRLAKNSDFYEFIDFIKKNTESREKGFFVAPYPFNLEWKFHIYPDIKFDNIEKVKYLIWYNPMWKNALFNFQDPVYNSWTLIWDNKKFEVKKEIYWKDYAKIYILE